MCLLILGFFMLVELFYYHVYSYFYTYSVEWKVQILHKRIKYIWGSFDYYYSMYIWLFCLVTTKISNTLTNFDPTYLIIIGLLVLTVSILTRLSRLANLINYSVIFVATSIPFLFTFKFIKSLFTFLFLIEFFGITYLFFFLSFRHTNKLRTSLKFKNLLVLYLWNSFLTTIFFIVGCYLILLSKGTLYFAELSILVVSFEYGVLLIFFSLAWKLGLPLFNFYKLQLYRYLLYDTFLIFSVVTVALNILLFQFYCTQNFVLHTLYSWGFCNFIVIFSSILILNSLHTNSFLTFIGFSGVITGTFFIICCCI